MYAPGDIVKFTVQQVYDAQTVLNVFYYEIQDPFSIGATPAEMGQYFWEHVQEEWRALVHTGVAFDRVVVENLDGDLSYGEYVIPSGERAGENVGVGMAAYECYAIQLNRTSRLVKQGAKRLVGCTEGSVAQYGLLETATLGYLQGIADTFADDLEVGLVTLCHPVIVGFPTDTRPVRVAVDIDTATAKPYTSTQNTRKRGHGS